MRLIDRAFTWDVAESGYEWRAGRGLDGVSAALAPTNRGGASTRVRPFEQWPDLYLRVAELRHALDGMEKGAQAERIRQFTNQYGPLADTVLMWKVQTLSLATAVRLWRAIQDRDRRGLRELAERVQSPGLPPRDSTYAAFRTAPTFENARAALVAIANHSFASLGDVDGRPMALRIEDSGDGAINVVVRPNHLQSVLWLQFLDDVRAGAKCKDCEAPGCGHAFVLRESDYSNRQYCGPSCKQRAWRATRRSRATKRKDGR